MSRGGRRPNRLLSRRPVQHMAADLMGRPADATRPGVAARGVEPLVVIFLFGTLGAGSIACRVQGALSDRRLREFGSNTMRHTFDKPKSGKSNKPELRQRVRTRLLPMVRRARKRIGSASRREHYLRSDNDRELLPADATGKYWGDLALLRIFTPASRSGAKSFTFGPLARTRLARSPGWTPSTRSICCSPKRYATPKRRHAVFVAWQSRS